MARFLLIRFDREPRKPNVEVVAVIQNRRPPGRFNLVVAERENMFMAADPHHKPSYFWNGREFTIDPKMQTITYLDTGTTYAFLDPDDRPRRPSSSPSPGRGR